jgi:hypothetical protein
MSTREKARSDRRARLVVIALVGAIAAFLVSTATAASAIVRETITESVVETGLTDDCRAGITGDLHGNRVLKFQIVENANGFHVQGTDGGPGRIDWSDGTYTLIDSVDRFAFNDVARGKTVVSNLTHVDSGDTYAADGTFLYRVTFHEVEKLTFANGVLRAEMQRGHFHFYGDC